MSRVCTAVGSQLNSQGEGHQGPGLGLRRADHGDGEPHVHHFIAHLAGDEGNSSFFRLGGGLHVAISKTHSR